MGIMRKAELIILSSLAALLPSCMPEQPAVLEELQDRTILTAGLELSTRTHLGTEQDGIVPLLWDAADELWINGEKFNVLSLSDDSRIAVLSGVLPTAEHYCAVYPYSGAAAGSGMSSISMELPAVQQYAAGSFAPGANPGAACWTSGTWFVMKNLASCLKLSLRGSGSVGRITVEDNDPSSVLWGTLTAVPDFETGTFSSIRLSNTAAGANVLTLQCAAPVALNSTEDAAFYFSVPAGAFAQGMTVSVYDASGNLLKRFATANECTTLRNAILSMKSMDISAEFLFSGGEGTGEKPWLISCEKDLDDLSRYVKAGSQSFAGAFYRQTCDIPKAAITDHIGTGTYPFTGTYDGAGHKISNISFKSPTDEKGHGLFGTLNTGAVLRGITVEGINMGSSVQDRQGAIAGVTVGALIEDCHLVGPAVALNAAQGGGIVGRLSNNSTVSNCTVTANLTNPKNGFGAIAGLTASGTSIVNCSVKSTLTSSAASAGIGGIVGYCESNLDNAIRGCSFQGTISAPSATFVGGILGYKSNRVSMISECTSSGSIACKSYAGGIVGGCKATTDISLTVSRCVSTADVKASADYAGGIIAYAKVNIAVIDACRASGNITANFCAGGIAAFLSSVTQTSATVSNCLYEKGTIDVKGNNANGYPINAGILGWAQTKGNIYVVNCVNRAKAFKTYTTGASYLATKDSPAGILSVQTTTPEDTPEVYGCYSSTTSGGYYCDGALNLRTYAASVFGILGSPAKYSIAYCYGPSDLPVGGTAGLWPLTVAAFTDRNELLSNLNKAARSYTGKCSSTLSGWVMEEDGYPMLAIFSDVEAESEGNAGIPDIPVVPGDSWTRF